MRVGLVPGYLWRRRDANDTLHRLATRIQARAIRRCGELLKTFQNERARIDELLRDLELSSVPVRSVVLNGVTAREWLIKAAVLRRHLSDDQRAMIAALYAKQHPKAWRGPEEPDRTAEEESKYSP